MSWGYCNDPYRERREGEDAYRSGWLDHDQRERVRHPSNDCDEEFARGYRDAERRADDERRAEEAAEERAAQRRHEARMEEERQLDEYYAQAQYESAMAEQYQTEDPPPLPPSAAEEPQ